VLIDWFTVFAQAVNFLILAWLLKRFLYGPIIKAMQERQERLVRELDSARQSRKEADDYAQSLSVKRDELERDAEAILDKARDAADTRLEQWLAEARRDVEARKMAWADGLEREQAALSDRLKARMAKQIMRLSEKVLRDLAGEDLEARVLDDFMSRLAGVVPDAQYRDVVVVRTGFPLSVALFEKLKRSVEEYFPAHSGIETSEDASLGVGIVMLVGDIKWEWSLASYLDGVEEAVFAELAGIKAAT